MRKFRPAVAAVLFLSLSLVVHAQTPLKPRDQTVQGPQTFAIVLGVSKYKFIKPLAYADKDALLFKDYLKSPGGGGVKDDNIFMLLNDKASNANFWGKGFQWLKAKKLQRRDRLFIYLAGHGDAIDEDQFFFLGYDCNPAGDKNNYLVAGAIQLFNLKKKIAAETTKGVEVFFIMDACRSNELPGGISGQNFLNTAISEKKAGEMIMLATGAGQESLEDASIGSGQGLFTYYLVDGLSGLADSIGKPDNRVTFQEIQRYVNRNVPSIALQRFKRKQDPYFCCNENSDKIISTVDTAYLQRWLRTKQQQRRGPGNSFHGEIIQQGYDDDEADTLLVETYNLFNRAISNNKVTGNNSAEEYFNQLNAKYPGNSYTLDAKSTLAVEFITQAQARIDKYLLCGETVNQKEKDANSLSANQLERAIAYVREDDEDFANSLLSRLYLLRAGGSNSSVNISLSNAYNALAIHPEGAYAMNRIALLHLENKRLDSALIYADKAVRTAPNWLCAITTLGIIQKAVSESVGDNKKEKNSVARKSSFGGVLGGGLSRLSPTYTDAPNSNITAVTARDIVKFDLGLIYQIGLGRNLSIRPGAVVSSEGGELIFETTFVTGGQVLRDTLELKNTSITISVPVILHFPGNRIVPYLSFGPSFNYIFSQNERGSSRVPIKKSAVLGDVGIGAEIAVGKTRLLLCPEIKYSQGISNQRVDARTDFTNNLSALRKRGITFSVFLKRK